jgi:cytochrome c oxidase subunit 2|tara:strand:- start:212 stop:727 length:516 start_codon:yes stop_codon:yes gene_type:complete
MIKLMVGPMRSHVVRLSTLVPLGLLVLAHGGCGRQSPMAWPESVLGRVCSVEVTGSRFEWSFRYPGGDGRFGTNDDLISNRDLHLPRGRTVDLKLTSTDFIYTLTLPELELEEIAVPQLVHTLRIDTDQVGNYRLLSDPMCAVRFSHDKEMGRVRIEETSAFRGWLATLVK